MSVNNKQGITELIWCLDAEDNSCSKVFTPVLQLDSRQQLCS